MDLTEARAQIDAVDRDLTALLEKRMDLSAAVADWKQAHGKAVLDPAREAEKLAAIEAMCRPETAPYIRELFQAVMAASRAYQTRRMEDGHGRT